MTELDRQIPIEQYDEVSSARDLARQAVEAGEFGDLPRMFVAARQTAGQGRFERRWISPDGGLWCTLVWPVNRDPARVLVGVGLRVCLACVRAVERTLAHHGHSPRVEMKWPNDVMVDGKRVLGVMCDVIRRQGRTYVLATVSLNANFGLGALPEALRDTATTLQAEIGGPVRMERLVDDLRLLLRDALMEEGLAEGRRAEIESHLYGRGRQARATLPDGETRQGVLLGIDPIGRLLLQQGDTTYAAPAGAELAVSSGL